MPTSTERSWSGDVSGRSRSVVKNRKRVRAERFSISMFENTPFGMDTSDRSNVRTLVDRKPNSSTTPTLSPNRHASPTFTGLSAISATPPSRFSSVL